MTLAELRKLARSRGYCRVMPSIAAPRLGWVVSVEDDYRALILDAFHPSRAVAIRMVAMGLRALPKRKP